MSKVDFVSHTKYNAKLVTKSPDIKDMDFLALALKLKSPLWSNDKILKKQDQVQILNSEEVIRLAKYFLV